jgi:thymidylate synthase ThyX
MVLENPVIPIEWGLDKPGMQAKEIASPITARQAEKIWRNAAMDAVKYAEELIKLGIHKQIANRLLEPFVEVTGLVTSVDEGLQNFFSLRAEDAADPHIQKLAYTMLEIYNASTPQVLQRGEWHIPFGDNMPSEVTDSKEKVKIAVARAARVSYNSFDGADTPTKDFKLHDRLSDQGHWSAFEHIAQVPLEKCGRGEGIPALDSSQTLYEKNYSGNLPGWNQLRKMYANEFRKDGRVVAK